jgi:predicted metal-binding membrane protein
MSTAANEAGRRSTWTGAEAWPVLVLVAVAAGCWAVTVERMQGMDMGPGTDLGGLDWFAVPWVTMMAAMMLPSLSPVAAASTRGAGGGQARSVAAALVLAGGYLLVWTAFGVLAYAVVEGVRAHEAGVLEWGRAGRYVAGGVIVAAAVYELSAAKRSCLRRCRDARSLHRRPGAMHGALLMGVEQGGFCVGSSGALMVALFALGVMSIAWMVVIAALIAIEKLLPWTVVTIGATAVVLVVLGSAVLFVPVRVPWLHVPLSM